jgi:hypothetical protein
LLIGGCKFVGSELIFFLCSMAIENCCLLFIFSFPFAFPVSLVSSHLLFSVYFVPKLYPFCLYSIVHPSWQGKSWFDVCSFHCCTYASPKVLLNSIQKNWSWES